MVTLQLSEKWGLKLNIPRHEKFTIRVIKKLPNSEQSYKVKTHKYINRLN